jgi:hypothetical protein
LLDTPHFTLIYHQGVWREILRTAQQKRVPRAKCPANLQVRYLLTVVVRNRLYKKAGRNVKKYGLQSAYFLIFPLRVRFGLFRNKIWYFSMKRTLILKIHLSS